MNVKQPKMDSALTQIVAIVDDDQSMRLLLTRLLERAGIAVKAYASAIEFLSDLDHERRGCLLLDVNMPDMTGLELQEVLANRNIHLPIIFLSGYGSIPMAINALKAGAVTFLEKPVESRLLLEAVMQALEHDRQQQIRENEQAARQIRLSRLTGREREVMNCLAEGKSNKELARELDISVRTVEIHRARVLEKLSADSVADIVRLVLLSRQDAERP